MNTPEEIKKGLWHCEREKCKGCPYYDKCMMADAHADLHADALEYIQQLENQIGELTEKVAQLEAAQSAAETFRRERDALIADLGDADMIECVNCAHYVHAGAQCEGEGDCLECDCKNCVCNECWDKSNWEWRGPQMKDEALQ